MAEGPLSRRSRVNGVQLFNVAEEEVHHIWRQTGMLGA